MTLVVGLTCEDGIVLASDSQVSAGTTRFSRQKVWAVSEAAFIFGLSGEESSLQLLEDELLTLRLEDQSLRTARRRLGAAVRSVLDPEYERVRTLRGSFDLAHMPIAGVILGTFTEEGPRLLVADHYANVQAQTGYVASGSGAVLANHAATVFRGIRAKVLTMHQTKMLALRIVRDAIEIAGPTLALNGPVQMSVLYTRVEPCS